ncbi:MAG: hypothetical protein U1D55_11355 [Phycisphaerae bacterium]
MRTTQLAGATILAIAISAGASATVVSISGAARVQIQEIKLGQTTSTVSDEEGFPGGETLPLQVFKFLDTPGDQSGQTGGAAAMAAQFADPLLQQPNPEEFAVNLSLNSVPADLRYHGEAHLEENRQIVFNPGELFLRPAGSSASLVGRLFIDGALTVYATKPDADLSSSGVTLRVTVDKLVSGKSDETVFSGDVRLTGLSGGNARVDVSGDFPAGSLILSDLSIFVSDFGVFRALILPNLQIDYSYPAIIGEPFTLRASVDVIADSVGGETGVAAVIGTPTDTIAQVIGAINGQSAATKFLDTLKQEREKPTGELVFPQPTPVGGLCGLFGFESLVGLGVLGFVKARKATNTELRIANNE